MAQDLCSVPDLFLSLFIDPSWQFFIPDILSGCEDDMIVLETHEVAQIAANAGPEASAKIKIIAIARNNLIL